MQLYARIVTYVLTTELEGDLRKLVVDEVISLGGFPFPDDLDARLRLRRSKTGTETTATLADLIEFSDLGDLEQLLNGNRPRLTAGTAEFARFLSQHIQRLVAIRNRVMHRRPLQFEDLPTIVDFCTDTVARFGHLFPSVQHALHTLKEEPQKLLTTPLPKDTSESGCAHNLPFPDFDETGYIGREEEQKIIWNHLRGPYPVISILGEGGLGKTALALKVAYDALDSTKPVFDSVIYSTAKARVLTDSAIRDVRDAVKTSTDLLKLAAVPAQTTPDADDPLEELKSYLENFHVLLILDNLETVLDENLKKFLQQIPSGTKVLLTSRVGLQSLDVPVTLKPLDRSVELLRATARARGAQELTAASNDQLQNYCDQLHNNPLAIKWFVTAVVHGSRPEQILRHHEIVLEFCFENVYQHLTDDARLILTVFQILRRPFDIAQLVVLTDFDAARITAAILQLDASNMIDATSRPSGGSYTTTYSLNDLSLAFLNTFFQVTRVKREETQKRFRRMQALVEEHKQEGNTDPFNFDSFVTRSDSERIVASILKRAVAKLRGRRPDYTAAERLVADAKTIAPQYFEVYRVEGLIHAKEKHSGEAQAAYEAAIQLDDRHAPLHYWLGQLLMREGDFDGAEKCLLRARLLSDNDPHVELEMARLLLFRGRFEDCRQAIDQLLVKIASVEIYTRQAYDILLQTRTRAADAEVRNRRPAAALPYLEAIRTQYEAVPAELHDRKMKHTISKAIPTASRVEKELRDGALASRAYEIRNWCETIHEELAQMDALVIQRKAETAVGAVLNGVILRITDRGFGFIKPIAKRPLPDVFFHRSEANGRWSDFHIGRAVSFELARDDSRRYFARNVQLLSED